MPFETIAVLPFRNPSGLSVLPRMVIRQGAKLNEKKKYSGKNFSKLWLYLVRLSSFLDILENTVKGREKFSSVDGNRSLIKTHFIRNRIRYVIAELHS